MNLTEDRLRAVLRRAGDEISPDRVRPLDLRPQRTLQLAARDRTERWRHSRWLQAVAAATAVAAVAIAATAIAAGTHGHRGPPSAVAPAAVARNRAVPSYYAAIMAPPRGVWFTTIRDTRTGAELATVRLPKSYDISNAVPGADDSFVLEAAGHVRFTLFLLRFNPANRSTKLTKLPIPATYDADGVAMSPDGTELALANENFPGGPSDLQIYTLSGRLIRQWQDPGVICQGWVLDAAVENELDCLSWTTPGYLAFGWTSNGKNAAADGIRLISPMASSGSLLGASRLAVPLKMADVSSFIVTGDGTTVAADVRLHPRSGGSCSAFEEFSAATGKMTRQYWPTRRDVTAVGTVLWSNWTGSELVVAAQFPRASPHPLWPVGILASGKFTPLPTPAPVLAIAF
jgi:hypothetical protein